MATTAVPAPVPAGAFLAISGRGFGAEIEPTPAADATVWSLVGLLVFCIVCFTVGGVALKRRCRKPPPLEELVDGGEREDGPANPAWQRPGDWWKQGGDGRTK